jgi:hypothetical protein
VWPDKPSPTGLTGAKSALNSRTIKGSAGSTLVTAGSGPWPQTPGKGPQLGAGLPLTSPLATVHSAHPRCPSCGLPSPHGSQFLCFTDPALESFSLGPADEKSLPIPHTHQANWEHRPVWGKEHWSRPILPLTAWPSLGAAKPSPLRAKVSVTLLVRARVGPGLCFCSL